MDKPLLRIDNLTIEATAYPPGEAPRRITIVDGVVEHREG